MATTINLVNLENVGKGYGTTTVLESVSLGIAATDRIGVVGRNGGGKSTLLRMITGAEPPDSGRATITGGLRIATVDQSDATRPGRTGEQRPPPSGTWCWATWPSTSGPATPPSARC